MKAASAFLPLLLIVAAGCLSPQAPPTPPPSPTVEDSQPAAPAEEAPMPVGEPAVTTPAAEPSAKPEAPAKPDAPAKPEAAKAESPAKTEAPAATKSETPAKAESPAKEDQAWTNLFDGRSLAGWKSTEFGGEGEVRVEDGAIVMEMGQDMSGITWAGKEPPPKTNYEISLEAQRVDGSDFFCGLTFPVNDAFCSFIVGGWGGGVVGLSSINGFDASENDTTQYMEFKTGQWYKIRVRVTPERIQTWIDGKEVVDQDIKDRKLSIRGEVELSKPLGISTWNTKAALRNIRLKKVDPPATAADK